MSFLDDVIQKMQELKDNDTEHKLFDDYCKARKQYLNSVKESVKGAITREEVKSYYRKEKEAFRRYLEHRIAFKGE